MGRRGMTTHILSVDDSNLMREVVKLALKLADSKFRKRKMGRSPEMAQKQAITNWYWPDLTCRIWTDRIDQGVAGHAGL